MFCLFRSSSILIIQTNFVVYLWKIMRCLFISVMWHWKNGSDTWFDPNYSHADLRSLVKAFLLLEYAFSFELGNCWLLHNGQCNLCILIALRRVCNKSTHAWMMLLTAKIKNKTNGYHLAMCVYSEEVRVIRTCLQLIEYFYVPAMFWRHACISKVHTQPNGITGIWK